MKLFYHLAILLLGFALITSCSEDDYFVTPTLKVSESSLSFTKAAGEKSVEVAVNQKDEFTYTVASPDGIDWIKVTQTGKELKVAVLENSEFKDRSATVKVLVLKGDLTETVTITQSAEDTPVMEISEGDMHLKSDEFKSVVYLTKNSDTPWSVESKEDWIVVTPDPAKDIFTIDVSANTTNDPRVGTVTVTCGDIIKSIEITQDGLLYFDLPYINFGFNFRGPVFGYKTYNSLIEASAFETKRGNKYVSTTYGVMHKYQSNSPVFPTIEYSTAQGALNVDFALFSGFAATVLPEGKFYEYLESKGFKKEAHDVSKKQLLYWNEELQLVAECVEAGKYSMIQFKPMGARPDHPTVQAHEYRTFDKIPLTFLGWGETDAEIHEWETATGSKLVETFEGSRGYKPDQAKEPWCIERTYMLDKTNTPATYTSSIQLFTSIDYGFYPSTNTTYVLTNEFKALLTASGFVFDRSVGTGVGKYNIYYNAELKVALIPQIKGFGSENYMPRFCITLEPQDAATGGSVGAPVPFVMAIKDSSSLK